MVLLRLMCRRRIGRVVCKRWLRERRAEVSVVIIWGLLLVRRDFLMSLIRMAVVVLSYCCNIVNTQCAP